MKKNMKITLGAAGIIVLLLALAIFGTEKYFENKFYPDSEFAGVDISYMTESEATTAVTDAVNNEEVIITEDGKEIASIPLGELASVADSNKAVNDYFEDQHDTMMLQDLFDTTTYAYNLDDSVTIDSEHLTQRLAEEGISNEERNPSEDASIQKVDGKYTIKEEVYGSQIDFSNITQQMYDTHAIDLNKAYIQPTRTKVDDRLQNALAKIEAVQNTAITLNINGNAEEIPQKDVAAWVVSDSEGNYSIDNDAIAAYLSQFNDKYATYQKDRTFESTASGTVTIPGSLSTLGWSIDRSATAENIAAQMNSAESATVNANIAGSGLEFGLGYGDSYIEVDMRTQQMFIYVDGAQVLSTPIISGHPITATDAGSYYVWNKEKDATLNGYNKRTDVTYATPVDYWIPFDFVGQGIHDASWQTDFGGDTYLTSGSNGCINVDPEVMDEVFDLAYIGMPVVVFY